MASNHFKLSTMMFLNIFVWGAWFPIISLYLQRLGFNPEWQQPLIVNMFHLAALTAVFFSQFADRQFSAERFLAFSMLVAGVAFLGLKWTTQFWPFLGLMLVFSLFYVPTISITNSIAFTHLRDPAQEFGQVRLWGTIGWIAAAWPFVFLLADWDKIPSFGEVSFGEWMGKVLGTSKTGDAFTEAASYMFVAAGGAAVSLAAFSLTLPHTPPKRAEEGAEPLAWVEALRLLRVPFVLVLFIVTFFDAAVHQMYFFLTGKYLVTQVGIPGNWVMPVMSIGQIAEIGTMAFLGYCLKALGWRITMVIGVLGHAARFTVFALAPEYLGDVGGTFLGLNAVQWAAISVNILHGICYAFFFATVYIFVDEFFPKDARASAQGLFNLLVLGLGPIAGNFAGGYLEGAFTDQVTKTVDFRQLFLVPAGIATFAALVLLLFFHPPQRAADTNRVLSE
jgi:MFS family permease